MAPPKARKQLLRLNGKDKPSRFIGFLNLKTSEDLLYRLSWQKQDTIIPVLEALIKNILINISASSGIMQDFTREKKIKKKLSTTLGRIHLIQSSSYAPDCNPQEHVWKYRKDRLANSQRDSLNQTVEEFERIIMSRKFNYQI